MYLTVLVKSVNECWINQLTECCRWSNGAWPSRLLSFNAHR